MTFQPVDPTIPLFGPPKSSPLAPRSVTAEMLADGAVTTRAVSNKTMVAGATSVTFTAGLGTLTHNAGFIPRALLLTLGNAPGGSTNAVSVTTTPAMTTTTAPLTSGGINGDFLVFWVAFP